MRVIAGSRRSMPLKAPGGMETRPTQDRTKETLFNVLQNDIPGAEFLDLYAGSGAISIEALSRGAKHATLVEYAKPAIQCIKDNLAFTKFTDDATLMEMDVFSAIERLKNYNDFDIIFIDPPYKVENEPQLFHALGGMKNITEDTIIVLEAALKREFSFLEEEGFYISKVKEYKTNQHIFIKKK